MVSENISESYPIKLTAPVAREFVVAASAEGINRRLAQTPYNLWIDMEKPNARGPTAGRKAHLALRDKLNRRSKPPPPVPMTKSSRKPAADLRRKGER